MSVEKKLYDYPHIGEIIQGYTKDLNSAIEDQKDTRDTLKAATITGMPHSTNVSNLTYQAVERTIDKWQEHIEYLLDQINYYMDLKKDVDRAIGLLTVEEYGVIDYRYFKQYKMRRIGYILHYGKTRLYEIHDSAIRKIEFELLKSIA